MEKLLIVGAELGADEQILRIIGREGYEAVVVNGLDQALDAIQTHSPGCALVDQQLEVDDGVSVLAALKEALPTCEVILLTGGGEMDTAIQVLRAGALDYLRKPVDAEQLRVALGRARERHSPPGQSEPPTILVIEDHQPTRERLAMVLKKEGYRVLTACDGAEGVAVFEAKHVDVILADLRMPKMSGLDVLSQTKGKGADVEVLVITGYGDEDDVIRSLRLGAMNFIKKPVDIEQLILSIQRALEFQQARRSLARRNRDLELMQQLVVRLTENLELIVEAPAGVSPAARDFMLQLVDCLPICVVVAGANRSVLFVNQHALEAMGERPTRLTAQCLQKAGVPNLDEQQIGEAFDRVLQALPGTIEMIKLSRWSFIVMTPLRLIRQGVTERFVAVAIRGERREPA